MVSGVSNFDKFDSDLLISSRYPALPYHSRFHLSSGIDPDNLEGVCIFDGMPAPQPRAVAAHVQRMCFFLPALAWLLRTHPDVDGQRTPRTTPHLTAQLGRPERNVQQPGAIQV